MSKATAEQICKLCALIATEAITAEMLDQLIENSETKGVCFETLFRTVVDRIRGLLHPNRVKLEFLSKFAEITGEYRDRDLVNDSIAMLGWCQPPPELAIKTPKKIGGSSQEIIDAVNSIVGIRLHRECFVPALAAAIEAGKAQELRDLAPTARSANLQAEFLADIAAMTNKEEDFKAAEVMPTLNFVWALARNGKIDAAKKSIQKLRRADESDEDWAEQENQFLRRLTEWLLKDKKPDVAYGFAKMISWRTWRDISLLEVCEAFVRAKEFDQARRTAYEIGRASDRFSAFLSLAKTSGEERYFDVARGTLREIDRDGDKFFAFVDLAEATCNLKLFEEAYSLLDGRQLWLGIDSELELKDALLRLATSLKKTIKEE